MQAKKENLSRKIGIDEFLGIKIHQGNIDYKILDVLEEREFNRVLIEYLGSENDLIRAYLFVPKTRQVIGGVLVHHQHNGERHIGKSEVSGICGDPYQFFCPELARKGITSIAPDSICFEDRRTNKRGIEPALNPEDDWLQHYNEMCYRILKGKTLMKKVIEDSTIGISLLLQQDGVKQDKVGILGHSYGGNTVIFHSPIDDRIKYSCSSGAVCSYKTKFVNNTGIEMPEVIPNFSVNYDIDDLLKMIYPRQILIISADSDKYSRDARQIIERVKRKVDKTDIEKYYYHKEFKGGHKLDEKRFEYIVNWFENKFKEKNAGP